MLSRHAGPGDSLLLVHHLLSVYHRRPRIVMKAALQLDPGLDVVANRVPNVFISPRQAGEKIYTDQIRRLAAGLGHDGALVIFPEGGNWTPGRWRRGIRRLERQGRADLAARARDMPHLLPPRTGGALAALAACPSADVIFVGHAGLDQLASVADVWRALPMDHVVRGPVVAGARRRGTAGRRSWRPGAVALRLVGPDRRVDLAEHAPARPAPARHSAARPQPAGRDAHLTSQPLGC